MSVSGGDETANRAGDAARLRAWLMATRLGRSVAGEGLRARAMRGAGWTFVGYGINQVLRLASSLILTRLLFPEAFGLLALGSVFVSGLQMFSDIGIGPSIIQNPRGNDPRFLNTAWTMQVIRGISLWIIACAIAYPVSVLYGEPALFPILCLLGSTAAIRGFQTTGHATSNRRIALGRVTAIDLTTHAVGLFVMVVWAWFHPTVWALVGGSIISAFLTVVLGFRLLNTHPHRLSWDVTAARELIRFGKWIFLSTAVTFLANSGDRIILPRVLDVRELSFYALALTLLMIPVTVLKQVASRVLFPVYSELIRNQDERRLAEVMVKYSVFASMLYAVPVVLIFASDRLISLMYDPRYSPAGPALTLLAVGGIALMMRASQAGLLLAAGHPKQIAVVQLGKVCVGLPLAVILARRWGLEGFCAGISAAECIGLGAQRIAIARVLPQWKNPTDLPVLLAVLAAVAIKSYLEVIA